MGQVREVASISNESLHLSSMEFLKLSAEAANLSFKMMAHLLHIT